MPLRPFTLIQSALKILKIYIIALNTNNQIQACGKLDPKIIIFPPNMYWPFC